MTLSSAGNLTVAGDLTVSGDDLTMGTNTSGAALIADGTNFNPVVISGDISIATDGVAAIGSGVIVTADIAADAITNAKIADNAIDSEHYTDGSIDTAHIADDQITLAKMASGTDGNIISYDASGNPVAIATGNDGQVLTSTGAGSPPAFEDLPSSGPSQANQAAVEAQTNEDTYVPPDLLNFHPGVAKGWCVYNQVANSILASLNVSSVTDTAAGNFDVLWDTDFSSVNYPVALSVRYNGTTQENNYTNMAQGTRVWTGGTDIARNYILAWGDQ